MEYSPKYPQRVRLEKQLSRHSKSFGEYSSCHWAIELPHSLACSLHPPLDDSSVHAVSTSVMRAVQTTLSKELYTSKFYCTAYKEKLLLDSVPQLLPTHCYCVARWKRLCFVVVSFPFSVSLSVPAPTPGIPYIAVVGVHKHFGGSI